MGPAAAGDPSVVPCRRRPPLDCGLIARDPPGHAPTSLGALWYLRVGESSLGEAGLHHPSGHLLIAAHAEIYRVGPPEEAHPVEAHLLLSRAQQLVATGDAEVLIM